MANSFQVPVLSQPYPNGPLAETVVPVAASGPGALIEMTTEMSGFSAAAVDASQFEVPAGFKKVESDLKRGAK